LNGLIRSKCSMRRMTGACCRSPCPACILAGKMRLPSNQHTRATGQSDSFCVVKTAMTSQPLSGAMPDLDDDLVPMRNQTSAKTQFTAPASSTISCSRPRSLRSIGLRSPFSIAAEVPVTLGMSGIVKPTTQCRRRLTYCHAALTSSEVWAGTVVADWRSCARVTALLVSHDIVPEIRVPAGRPRVEK